MNHKIRVLIADSTEIFREGLAKILEEQEHIEVVSKCDSGKQAVRRCREMGPDVVLLGANLSDEGRAQSAREINGLPSKVRVAVLTDLKGRQELVSALEAGATGYLSKDIRADSLIESVDLIAEGEIVISPPLGVKSRGALPIAGADDEGDGIPLTVRERETMRLLAEGASTREMSERLIIAESTVKVHVKHILEKLQLRNRQQAAAFAVRRGLVRDVEDSG